MGVGPKAQKISPIQPYAFMRKATDEAGDRRKEWLTPTQMKSETPKTNWCVKSEQVFFFVRRALRLALHELQVWQHLLFFWKRTSPCCPFSPGMFSPHANLVHTEKVWLYFHDFEFLYWVALQGTIRFVKHAKKQKNKEPRTTLFVAVETHALAWQKSKPVCLWARQTLQANAIPMEAEEGKITCGCFSATYYLLL